MRAFIFSIICVLGLGFVTSCGDDYEKPALCWYHDLGFASSGDCERYLELRDMRQDAIDAMNDLDPNGKNYEGKVEDHKGWIKELEDRMDALVLVRY